MHVWKRDEEGSLQCVIVPKDAVTREEYATSFVGQPENIWTYVVEEDRGGFHVPSIAAIASILRGKSRPDMDQDMAVLTELIQTGL